MSCDTGVDEMSAALVKITWTQEMEVSGLGKRIEAARRQSKRSVADLAKAAGISRAYWYDLEQERIRQSVPIETIRNVEESLGVDFGVSFDEAC